MSLKITQDDIANTYAAFAQAREFSNLQEFEKRAAVFKKNLQRLRELNANISDFFVSAAEEGGDK